MKKTLTLIVFLVLGSIYILDAQVTTASVFGDISDSNGEPLIGATIMATHVPSGSKYGTTSRADGTAPMTGSPFRRRSRRQI